MDLSYFKSPITANFIITRNCNGNCAFCGVKHNDSFAIDIDCTQAKKIVDALHKSDVLRINYFGGEPTVYPHLVEVAQYSKQLEFYNSIVTNALHIPQQLEEFSRCFDAIAVSIHGEEEMHCRLGNVSPALYYRILKNLDIYAGMNIPLTINMTVTPDNYLSIYDFVSGIVKRFPVQAFAFNRYIPSQSVMNSDKRKYVMNAKQINQSLELIDRAAKENPNLLFKYAIHFPYCVVTKEEHLKYVGNCGVGQNYISIDCDGNIQMCSYSDKILGNIFENDLKDIWNNHSALKAYRELSSWLPVKCRTCKYCFKCLSGCKVTGDGYYSPDIMLSEDNF